MKPLALALVVVIAAQSARADDRKAQAKRDVTAGLAAQSAGKYDEAIALYKKAYDAVPHPEILFDLAQAYRLKGDVEAALDYYERYLSVEPNGRASKDAARWTGELEKQVEARKAERAKREADARAADEARKAEEAHKGKDAHEAKVPAPPPQQSPPPAPRSNRKTYAIAATAAGGAATITGLVFGQLARAKQDDAKAVCPGGTCATDGDTARANSLLAQSRTRGNVSTALVAVGAGGLVAGAVLWWTDRDTDAAPRTSFAPVVTSSQIGLSVGGAW